MKLSIKLKTFNKISKKLNHREEKMEENNKLVS